MSLHVQAFLDGVAPAELPLEVKLAPSNPSLPASGDSVTAVAAHSGSEIGPVWPSMSVALEEVN